jgi:hypothetical protein
MPQYRWRGENEESCIFNDHLSKNRGSGVQLVLPRLLATYWIFNRNLNKDN